MCEHKNFVIMQASKAWKSHYFEDGEYQESVSGFGDEYATVEVHCHDCDKYLTYSIRHAPKWLRKALEQINLV